MLDSYNREIDYLRVSVTDRCNLRCRYCMPEEGIESIGHLKILTLEQISQIIKVAIEQIGIKKIRLTGGEPLVRKGIVNLIHDIAKIPKIEEIAITTNGILFYDMAEELQQAGLSRVNFSLDSLKNDKFNYITRFGHIDKVFNSIQKAIDIGLAPVKINTVVMKGFNDDEILDFVKLAYDMPVHVRFIEFMPVGDLPFYTDDKRFSVEEMKDIIRSKYVLTKGSLVQGNGPAKCFNLNGGRGSIGFISAMSDHFCGQCNRLRLTADGKLRACLYSSKETNLKMALDNGANEDVITRLIDKTILEKPNRHHMTEGWGTNNVRKMYQIGG